ncbi:unnamed protein product [Trichobilharzia szidati]|nr:unnamed protein product [Trichobilharzia szidati]
MALPLTDSSQSLMMIHDSRPVEVIKKKFTPRRRLPFLRGGGPNQNNANNNNNSGVSCNITPTTTDVPQSLKLKALGNSSGGSSSSLLPSVGRFSSSLSTNLSAVTADIDSTAAQEEKAQRELEMILGRHAQIQPQQGSSGGGVNPDQYTLPNVFGQHVLIQFEDFANHNAFRLLQKYAPIYSTFNDDIQGTASVVLAALLASLKLTGRKLTEESIVCYGAGEANLGFAHLVCLALNKCYGLTMEEARQHIYLIDSKGLIVEGRKSGGINSHKLQFARPSGTPELTSLAEIIKYSKCTSLIGAAAIPKVFDEHILNLMAEMNEKPVIMALSNPTLKAECTAEEAYLYTHGRCVFASGSPFPSLTLTPEQYPQLKASITRCPGQANNSYIFPSVALAIVSGKIFPVTNEDFLIAAQTLASLVSESDYAVGRLFPPLTDIKRVSAQMAVQIVKNASQQGRCYALKSNDLTIEELISNFSYYPRMN